MPAKILWSILPIILAAFICSTGCSVFDVHPTEIFARHSDPLVGWSFCRSQDPDKFDGAIRDDYHGYIQALPPQERKNVTEIWFYQNEAGQLAVRIEIGLNGTWWQHVLIYDKNHKRIKVIKYISGHYMS